MLKSEECFFFRSKYSTFAPKERQMKSKKTNQTQLVLGFNNNKKQKTKINQLIN